MKLKARTAEALPEVNAAHTHFVIRLRRGIRFPDDPAFKGQPRELTAADYVYSIKRYYDPATRSPTLFHYQNAGLIGLSELRTKAIETQTPFPYDQEVEGLRVVDRYTFEIRTARPAPRLPYVLATPALAGAVAREVVEGNPARAMEHPVGTGPYRLADWKRRSRIVLERNPLHDGVYDEQPAAGDAQGAAIAERFRGRALPMLDRVEISIIEESQPRWLAFLNGEIDLVAVPADFNAQVAPGGRIAPNLAKQGIVLHRAVQPLTYYTYFGMEDPVLGGYEPHQVALRRALALAYNAPRENALVRKGQLMPAQSVLPPLVSGYDPKLKTEMSEYNPPRARALLELYGYVDRDGDGWREQPDGSPLVLEFTTEASQLSARAQRGLAGQLQGHRRARELPQRHLAGEHQGQPRRQAADVGHRLERRAARRRLFPRRAVRPEQGPVQPRPLRPAGLQCAVRAAAPAARRPRARRPHPAGAQALGGLHADQGHRPRHRAVGLAPARARLRAAPLHPRILALPGRRSGAAGALSQGLPKRGPGDEHADPRPHPAAADPLRDAGRSAGAASQRDRPARQRSP